KPTPSKPVQPVTKQQVYNGASEKNWDWNFILSILLTAFSGSLVVVTWLLVAVGRKQTEYLKRQEAITKKSVDVAEIALKSDRPYLLVEKAELCGVIAIAKLRTDPSSSFAESLKNDVIPRFEDYQRFQPRVIFHFRNYGKGPALLDEVLIRLKP